MNQFPMMKPESFVSFIGPNEELNYQSNLTPSERQVSNHKKGNEVGVFYQSGYESMFRNGEESSHPIDPNVKKNSSKIESICLD